MAKAKKLDVVKVLATRVYTDRKARVTHPEGSFDNAGRFYPSACENLDDYTTNLRSPSRAWPFSYMVGARTLKHCRALVEAALSGASSVPDDVAAALLAARKEPELAVAIDAAISTPIAA